MKIDQSQFLKTFLQESAEHIESMEAGLLELRSAPDDVELLNSIFRAAHSIKGGAGFFGMTNLVHLTHSLESLLEHLRSLEMKASDEVIDVLLRSVDVLRDLLDAEPNLALPAAALELKARIEVLIRNQAGLTEAAPQQPQRQEAPPFEDARPIKLYRIEFRPHRGLFSSGTNPILLLRNLASLGIVGCCHLHTENLPALDDLDPSQCYLSWTMELASSCAEEELREVFEFVEHLAEIEIHCADGPHEIEVIPDSVPQDAPPQTMAAPPPLSPPPASAKRYTAAKKYATGGDSSLIRVSIDKVDRLIDLVGELVIAHVMTAQMVADFEPSCLPKLREAVASMERNTRELHERVMAVRMLPVASLFQRYSRAVYDIAQATGKQIRLETSGDETEIDRSMLELLGDPLTHLVRNSADHGIETPEVRRAAGKPEEGLIALKAFHRAGKVVIEISDDGGGIDTDRVRRKAIERGLMDADSQLSDDEVRMLIFEPGFSTREEINDLSGRGVGMDVVKRNVQQLNGTLTLTSEKGFGVMVSIELPLTLAILEGLLVRVGDRTLVLPLLSVIETVPLRNDRIVRVAEQGEVVVIRDRSIPLLRLSRFLGLAPETQNSDRAADQAGNRRLAVIVEAGKRKVGLVVDELLGQQQVVVKSLERHLRKVDGLMGATILGDGCVAPIVDVACLASMNLFGIQASSRITQQVVPPAHSVRAASPTTRA